MGIVLQLLFCMYLLFSLLLASPTGALERTELDCIKACGRKTPPLGMICFTERFQHAPIGKFPISMFVFACLFDLCEGRKLKCKFLRPFHSSDLHHIFSQVD